jgi:hypothetical protein
MKEKSHSEQDSTSRTIPPLAEKIINEPKSRPRMVEWYNPKQLIVTGIKTVLSTVFGRYSDFRLMEAFGQRTELFSDFSKAYIQDAEGRYAIDKQGFYHTDPEQSRDEIWIDYVSDLGDGFNSTYTIAYYLSRPELQFDDPHTGTSRMTSRGNVLIFGGDQVYPTANREEYASRLVTPYYLALRHTLDPHPQVFAIPGNHDWYDGLISFTRIFCSRKWFNGWQSPQQKSYFALKLPHGWWLLGTDVQLNSDIDGQQVQYFEQIAEEMQEDDRVILCNAEPYWISAQKYGDYDPTCNENNLAFLENIVKKRNTRIQVFIAGDIHHYRRFEHIPKHLDGSENHSFKVEKITAGGGGAFLHPTHDLKTSIIQDNYTDTEMNTKLREFKRIKDYPNEQVSRRLGWGNLLFIWKNKKFGIVTALLYLFACNSVLSVTSPPSKSLNFGDFILTSLSVVTRSPKAFMWILIIIGGFWLFTDTRVRIYKWIAGCLHGFCHVTAAFFIGCGAVYTVNAGLDLKWGFVSLVLSSALIAIGGWLVGSVIMGLYLFISLNFFGRHSNEAFSSLKIEDWKNFLRIHIDKDGSLTIYPIGVEKIVRRWKQMPITETGPLLEPDLTEHEREFTIPKLIESPIVIPPIARK